MEKWIKDPELKKWFFKCESETHGTVYDSPPLISVTESTWEAASKIIKSSNINADMMHAIHSSNLFGPHAGLTCAERLVLRYNLFVKCDMEEFNIRLSECIHRNDKICEKQCKQDD
jgi:hypothetical protein